MWSWIVNDPQVKTLRYTVSPDNLVSLHIIKNLNFNLIGEQIDEKDGLELIYELSAEKYQSTIGS